MAFGGLAILMPSVLEDLLFNGGMLLREGMKTGGVPQREGNS
jgi:hypothetical protein